MSVYSSLAHADHNQDVCRLLVREAKYDWAVVTAFYSSIHYLYDSLFPMNCLLGGRVMPVASFTDYCKLQSHHHLIGKHELLGKAVKESNLPANVRTAYEMLKSESFTARYNNYRQTKINADQAMSRLDLVKKGCEALRQGG